LRLKNFISTICLTTYLAASTSAQFLFPTLARAAPRKCIPIAYVLSNDAWNWKIGDLLCAGDVIFLRGRQPLTVQCFGVGTVNLSSGVIPSSGCGIPRESGAWSSSGSQNLTVTPRGTAQSLLRILEPGRTIKSTRPRLSWQSVPGATSYRVWIFGNVSWSTVTTKTQLSYPATQPALRPGSAYRIVVSAYRGENLLLSGEQAVNLPQSRVSQADVSSQPSNAEQSF